MRFASLGSGSRGNALVVDSGATRVLVDCGFGPRELARRLARLGLAPGDLDGVLVTHEHTDHAGGVARCAARHGLRVFMTHGTRAALGAMDSVRMTVIDSHAAFLIGDIEVQAFPVPHDAREPVQFVFAARARRLAVLTDAGHVTAHAASMVSDCDAIVIECNHDLEMLMKGNYPWPLKKRIAGPFGHLDNGGAAALLGTLDRTRLQHVVAAHLSEHNNEPELARTALASVLACPPAWICAATQEEGFSWRELA